MPAVAGASEIREAEDLTRELFAIGDEFDVVLFQAEAIALLEASVKGLGVPDRPAASVMTSIYGDDMDAWFQASGAPTVSLDLRGQDRAATGAEVERLLDSAPGVSALAIVQGEALTGMVNPVDEIAAVASARGVSLMIDSVSSVGAEPLTPERWGRAISVIGAQKGLGGPSGLSVAVIEKSLWYDLELNPSAPRRSFLSLLDIKYKWLDHGRTEFFGMASAEELLALRKALRSSLAQGIEAIESRHQQAKQLARDAIRGIDGLSLTVADADASGISTTFRLQDPGLDRRLLLDELVAQGVNAIKTAPAPRNLRWSHYHDEADPDRIELVVGVLAASIGRQRDSSAVAALPD
jgi:aspartate aminotransferase-like enzyme